MGLDPAALQKELQELREENAALLEALHLAQRGGADLRGHLSKWNPDAKALGIYAQDWELRYFVLSGTLLKYYSSERDVGYDPRGVLELQDCSVKVELPVKSTGPFIFQIIDPDNELLLRLSADRLATAKTWVRTLAAAGLRVQGFERFMSDDNARFSDHESLGPVSSASNVTGLNAQLGLSTTGVLGPLQDKGLQPAGPSGLVGAVHTLAGLGRVLSGRWTSNGGGSQQQQHQHQHSHWPSASTDSSTKIVRLKGPSKVVTIDEATSAAPSTSEPAPATTATEGCAAEVAPAAAAATAAQPATGEDDATASQQPWTPRSLAQKLSLQQQHLYAGMNQARSLWRIMSTRTNPSGLQRAPSARRWGKEDMGDELPSCEPGSVVQKEPEQAAAATAALQRQLSQQQSAVPDRGAAAVPPAAALTYSTIGQQQQGGQAFAVTEQPAAAAETLAAAAASGGGEAPGLAGSQAVAARPKPKGLQMDGASPVHIAAKDSILTWQDDWGVARHEGLLNLGMVVLLATNIRLVMSNIFMYGLRLNLNPASWVAAVFAVASGDNLKTWLAIPGCILFSGAALMVEVLGWWLLQQERKLRYELNKKDVAPKQLQKELAAKAASHEGLLLALHILNVGCSLVLPCAMVLYNEATLVPSFALTFTSIITFMKLTSYAHCNITLRKHARNKAAAAIAAAAAAESVDQSPFLGAAAAGADGQETTNDAVVYPNNLNLGDMGYYLLAPTLTYQLNFPRSKVRRPKLLLKWVGLLLLTAMLMSFMQVQFLLPCMQSSLGPLREMNLLAFTERLLRLSIPNLAVWLVMFYLVFHLWLNILGELMLFGDRTFYKEWWNAATLADYWKLWNIPVHKWMLRTVFFPLIHAGVGKYRAMLVVFFVSAALHELAVGVPLRMLRGWAFWGMMAQVPLIGLTEKLRKRIKSDSLGNMMFWASFCVFGQPMCLILYYHDWLLNNIGMQGLAQAAAAGAGSVATAAAASLASTGAAAINIVAPAAR